MHQDIWNAGYARAVGGQSRQSLHTGKELMLMMKGRQSAGADPTLTSNRYLARGGFLGLSSSIRRRKPMTMDSDLSRISGMRLVEFRSQVMMAQGATITRDR